MFFHLTSEEPQRAIRAAPYLRRKIHVDIQNLNPDRLGRETLAGVWRDRSRRVSRRALRPDRHLPVNGLGVRHQVHRRKFLVLAPKNRDR
jgi:hypothetical protein